MVLPTLFQPFLIWQSDMIASNRCVELIKRFEGYRFKAYQCPAGVWTIGYGHTKGVKKGDYLTHTDAEKLLKEDITAVESEIKNIIKVPLSANQWDAIVSFVFNVGIEAFKRSTLLVKLNEGDLKSCGKEIKKWIYCKGVVSKGLQKRRDAEAKLFNENA